MFKTHPHITLGIVSYQDIRYLKICLPAILQQDYTNFHIIICDNNPDLQTTDFIQQNFPNHPKLSIINQHGNIGFGKAHNLMIKQAIQNQSTCYLAFNSDLYPKHNYLSNLINCFQKLDKLHPNQVACLTPTLLKWQNFPNNPTQIQNNIYDSTGIQPSISHKFSEANVNQSYHPTTQPNQIWGASGASPIYLLKALQDIQHSTGEFFDNNFFMYKEDIDLSYRLLWAGYKTFHCPKAIAWHDRTGADPGGIIKQIKSRQTRGSYIKENSFLNQLQLIYKNWDPNFSLKTKLQTTIYLTKYIIYLLLFDPKILKQYSKFKKLKPELLQKRNNMPRRISPQQIQKFLSGKL